MADMKGWVSIHRSIRSHWIWRDPVKLKWWLDILLTVNHKDSKVNVGMQLFECKRGQSVMTLKSWANRWKVSKDSTRNFFELLKKDGMIHTENLLKTTRLTVCNYDLYQIDLHAEQTLSERCPNAEQTLAGTNNNVNNWNNKNNENNKESISPLSPLKGKPKKSVIDLSFISPDYMDIVKDWLTYKKEKGQAYKGTQSVKTFFKRLIELSENNPDTARKIIDNSISNNYAGIFELNSNKNGRKNSNPRTGFTDASVYANDTI